jgi:hypothetical protein
MEIIITIVAAVLIGAVVAFFVAKTKGTDKAIPDSKKSKDNYRKDNNNKIK